MAVCKALGVTVTEPSKVDIGSVEGELSNLWRKVAEGGVPGFTAPIARTILSNLVVYAATDKEAEAAKAVITEMAADHPSRAVIADAQAGVPEKDLKAEVSMLCSITERGRRLCGEEIRLHAHGATVAALGSIFPVLVADLPVYLWTPGDLDEPNDILNKLVHISDHWIINSRIFTSRVKAFDIVHSLSQAHQPPILLHDLAWVPVSQRCAAIAMNFDAYPAREYLLGVRNVVVSYKQIGDIKPGMEPILIAAWLIHQLKFRPLGVEKASNDDIRIIAASDSGEVYIRLIQESELPFAIGGVVIESELDGKHAAFRMMQTPQEYEVTLETEAPDIPGFRRTVRLTPNTSCNEVRQVLDSPDKDRLYEQVFPTTLHLLKLIG